jgi:hypothetical protein
MIRIIVRHDDAGMASNVGGSVLTKYKTFDISAPEVENYIKSRTTGYSHAQISGAEIIEWDQSK